MYRVCTLFLFQVRVICKNDMALHDTILCIRYVILWEALAECYLLLPLDSF